MAEIFDVYSRRTLLYKILNGFGVLFALTLIGMFFSLPTGLNGTLGCMYIIAFAVSFIITLIGMFRGYMPACKLYIKDAELIISDVGVDIGSRMFALTELKHIEITAYNYRGKGSKGGVNDGTGNKILIVTQQGEELHRKFVINSAAQWKNLTAILKLWKQSRFEFIANGIDLI